MCAQTCSSSAVPRRGGLRRLAGWAVLVVSLAVVLAGCSAFREPAIQPITVETLHRVEIPALRGKTAVMDILDLDQAAHRLYVTDGLTLGIDIIDTSTVPGRYLKSIRIGSIPNGVVVAPDLHRVFVGSDESALVVLDVDPASAKPDSVEATISITGAGASDLIEYDRPDHRVFLANPDDGIITVFDAHSLKMLSTIGGLGLVDQPRYNAADGMLYVSEAERNSIITINPRTATVVAETPIPLTCEPHGLAIDPTTNLGIIGCNDKDDVRTVSWDFAAKRMVRSFDQAGAGDQVIFDPVSRHFYFAASSYAPAEIAIFQSAASVSFLTGVPTSHKSKGVAYDEAHHWIYTYDGKHREAGVWGFPDPLVSGRLAAEPATATVAGSAGAGR
jgi:DNA-binding beta-propeller fold protein YncE